MLPYLAYPGMTAGAVAFGYWAIGQHWRAWQVSVVAIAASVVLTQLLEWTIPYRRAWSEPKGDRFTDLMHMLVSNRAFDVGTLAAMAACAPLAARLGSGLWPHHWPIALQAVMAALAFELPWYWMHRLEHASSTMWRVHSVHHS